MNKEAQKIFNKIVKKNPQDLSDDEVGFIHARQMYLTDDQVRVFKPVLDKRQAEIDKINNPEPEIYISKKDRQKNANKQ